MFIFKIVGLFCQTRPHFIIFLIKKFLIHKDRHIFSCAIVPLFFFFNKKYLIIKSIISVNTDYRSPKHSNRKILNITSRNTKALTTKESISKKYTASDLVYREPIRVMMFYTTLRSIIKIRFSRRH